MSQTTVISSMATVLSPQEELLEKIRGQTIHVPSLRFVFGSQLPDINLRRPVLRPIVNDLIDRLFPDNERKAKAMKSADLGFLSCLWWPTASLDRLWVLACATVWLLIWDDEIEAFAESEDGNLLAEANAYRESTLRYVGGCLGLPGYGEGQPSETKYNVINQFKVFGGWIKEHYNQEQRQRLMNEIEHIIDMSHLEHQVRLHGRLPCLQEYWEYRLGVNLMGAICALTEYSNGTNVGPAMQRQLLDHRVQEHTNRSVAIINDILSLQKEIVKGEVVSLITLLYASHGSLQKAADTAVDMLRDDIKRIGGFSQPPDKAARKYIESCQTYAAGFLYWSLLTPRYGLGLGPADMTGNLVMNL